MAKVPLDDCFAHDGGQITHDQAIALLRQRIVPVVEAVPTALAAAAGRTLAAPVHASRPIPFHTNSAVDGYGYAHRAPSGREPLVLRIVGRAAAGHPFAGTVPPDACVRILTGAVVPSGVDMVAMQEDVVAEGGEFGHARLPAGLARGANIRARGEDVGEGERLFEAGHVLRPQDLAALASAGLDQVPCNRPLRVGVFSTGDEVVRPGTPLREGQVYDANAPMIEALAAAAGAITEDLGILPDDGTIVRTRLAAAAERLDVLITSGGASQGEEDHVVRALDAIGRRHLWRIAIKPGRPISLGQIGRCTFIGLPGNPVAVFVCFLLYAWPMLHRLGGAAWPEPRRLLLPTVGGIAKKPGRREYWRGILRDTPNGLAVEKFARDGSGLITSLRVSDGLIEGPEAMTEARPGDPVAFIPFESYGIARR